MRLNIAIFWKIRPRGQSFENINNKKDLLLIPFNNSFPPSPEEYIFAALNIYLDVVNLFMYILMIVGFSRGDWRMKTTSTKLICEDDLMETEPKVNNPTKSSPVLNIQL